MVVDYQFISADISTQIGGKFTQTIMDQSGFNFFDVQVYGVDANYFESTYSDFYNPVEVNGSPGVSASGEIVNAHEALYSYTNDLTTEESTTHDPQSL